MKSLIITLITLVSTSSVYSQYQIIRDTIFSNGNPVAVVYPSSESIMTLSNVNTSDKKVFLVLSRVEHPKIKNFSFFEGVLNYKEEDAYVSVNENIIFESDTVTKTSGPIGFSSVAEIKQEDIVIVYDSSKNYIGNYEDPSVYKGQTLFLPGKSESLRKYGYDDFLIDMNGSSYSKDNEYKEGDYNSLANTYFDVIDVLKKSYGEYYLKLKNQKDNTICYFKYSNRFEHAFPFIVVSYFEYVKNNNVGKKIVTRGINWFSRDEPMSDMNTGEIINFEPGIIWEIKGLTIEQKYYNLSFILENEKGNQITFTSIDNLPYSNVGLYYDDVKEYEGTDDWDKIINGKVRIGFTKEMALLSWGEPEKVNRSSWNEQWVYGNQYLYFEDGVMTSFN
jgi:hypothetical protein